MPKWTKYLEDDFEEEYIPVERIPHKKKQPPKNEEAIFKPQDIKRIKIPKN